MKYFRTLMELEEKITHYRKRINEINAKLESGVNL
jgi:hypothetical protein